MTESELRNLVPDGGRILVIHVSRIGDTLLATPSLRALAEAFPTAEMTVLGHPKRVEILDNLPFIHRTGPIDKKTAGLKGRMPGRQYDLAVVFGNDAPLIRYALRVSRKVVAMRQKDEALNQKLYAAADEPGFQAHHAVFMQAAILKPLGIEVTEAHLSYAVKESEKAWAKKRLSVAGFADRHPMIGLQIASFPTKGYRDWPVEHFIELCQRLAAAHPEARFLVLGGPLEKDRTEQLHAALGERSQHLAGSLSLRETGAMMSQLDLYVGVDTGPTHIMGAQHRPMVVMYHSSSPAWMLQPLEHPCLHVVDHHRAGEGFDTSTDIGEITVDEVFDAAQLALRNGMAGCAKSESGTKP